MDDEKAAQAVKALFATGFFRDVRLEREGDVLVVVVQERPTISSLDLRRQQGIRHRHDQEGAEATSASSEARIFDRASLDRAEQELKRQYITPRPLQREGADHGDAAGAQPRRGQLQRSRKASRPRSRGSTSSGTKAFTEAQLLQRDAR